MKPSLRSWCDVHDIPLMGVADPNRWKEPPYQPWIPEAYHPDSIFPGIRSVITIGLPVHLPSLESSPSIQYREMYRTVNALLDQYTYRIAERLNRAGHPSVSIPRDGYAGIDVLIEKPIAFFSHRHAAYLAGLGTFGLNNTLLTPGYGPRVRFGSVFTTLEMEPDPVQTTDLCIRCMECVDRCPVRAVSSLGYPEGRTNKMACAKYSAGLNKKQISPCGVCIKVCPVGSDRILYGREDIRVYREDEGETPLKKAWEHIRSHGSI